VKELLSVVETIGIPAAVAVGMGYLVWTLFKNLIADIHKKLDTQHGMIVALIDRIRQMDNDMIRIDTLVRTALKLPPDVDRISRADGKKDHRKD
jgi:hypothetical protein